MGHIITGRPESEFDWRQENLPPVEFSEFLLSSLKLFNRDGLYPFKNLHLYDELPDDEKWKLEGVYDDDKTLGYFSIGIRHPGEPWKGFSSVYQYHIRAADTQSSFFSKSNPTETVSRSIEVAKAVYLEKFENARIEIEALKEKAKRHKEKVVAQRSE